MGRNRLATAHARAVAGLVALMGACHPTTPPQRPAGDSPGEPTQPAEPTPPAEPAPCGPVGERFDDHAWVPASATTVASLDLASPELPAALRALADHARAPGHGLPIPLSFSIAQWSWQVPVLVATLRRAGLAPAELVLVGIDGRDAVWILPSTCDLDEAIARAEAAWSVRSRRTVEAVVASPNPTTDDPAFPYDVLWLPGQRMALAPAGRGAAALEHLGRPGPAAGLGLAPSTAGPRLDALAPAPVRLVVIGRGLLEPGSTTAEHHALRVTGAGVEDASLPPP